MKSSNKNNNRNETATDLTRKVMMNKYGLEEGKTYAEANTLLEPNNFIPSWEDGGEEKQEVSTALRRLREDYDIISRKTKEKSQERELQRADIKKANEEEKRVSRDFGGANDDMVYTKGQMTYLQTGHQVAQMDNMAYNYMLDRMKRDLISLSLTINDLTESLRSKKQIADDEQSKHMKSREQKLQSRSLLDNLMQSLDLDQKKRQERILALNVSIKNKEEAIQKRNERKMRQNKIREEAQNESKDQNEIQLRANWHVQRVWSQFYKKRMDREMKNHKETEQAYQQIKACAGNDDVKEIVSKFMSREQTYQSLLSSVKSSEDKYEMLKAQCKEKEDYLHSLHIEYDNKKEVGFIDPRNADRNLAHELKQYEDDNKTETEYKRLAEEMEQLQVHLEQLKQRKKNIQLITDQVGGWTTRVGKKMADQLDDHTLMNMNAPLNQQFKNIATMVHQQLNHIMDARKDQGHDDEDSDESLNVKELINDFATDEFVQKNVRVRPTSSYSTAGKDQSEIGGRGQVQAAKDEEEDERKFNKDTQFDLTMQRNETKERSKKEEQERLIELEKAEKKKRAKQ